MAAKVERRDEQSSLSSKMLGRLRPWRHSTQHPAQLVLRHRPPQVRQRPARLEQGQLCLRVHIAQQKPSRPHAAQQARELPRRAAGLVRVREALDDASAILLYLSRPPLWGTSRRPATRQYAREARPTLNGMLRCAATHFLAVEHGPLKRVGFGPVKVEPL
jgi:hypothetical protein